MNARILSLFSLLCLVAVTVLAADSAADLRRRMEQRLSVIDRLKAEESVGENNRGLLELRGSGAADAGNIVAEENRDREAVYSLIAKETGATPESVGRARAKQIASGSRTGVWVQSENGTWKKK
jgi:uncharacterized protein YdbL (DUF1318 family)